MTTGFQFAHLQWSAKIRVSKRQMIKGYFGSQRGKGWSASDILAEAERKIGHCSHVENPKPPNRIHGAPLDQVEEYAERWAATQKVSVRLKNGVIVKRKMRSDAPILASGVISFPKNREDRWPAFRDHAIKQLKKKYGERLVSAVEHLDESHPHLHFYLVPNAYEDFGTVHAGYAASRAARKSEGNFIRKSYIEAMQVWQDWVQENICASFDLARIGPRRARRSNDELKADKAKGLLVERETAAWEKNVELEKKGADLECQEALIERKKIKLEEAIIQHTKWVDDQSRDIAEERAKLINSVKENENMLSKMKADLATIDPEYADYLASKYRYLSQDFSDEGSTNTFR